MPTVEELLGPLAREAEREIRPRLQGFIGGMLRHYLPQVWVFRTEVGVASLCVAPDGAVTVAPNAVAPADVTVEVGHERLRSALATRGKTPAPGPLTVTPHTAKGRAAFDYLRPRIGL
ncbi:MAG: hypothetical protein ACLQD8_04670 [Thermoplasmata archaeon]